MAIVLCDEHTLLRLGVLHGGERCELRQVIRTDDDATGMYANLTDGIFELCGVLQGVAQYRIVALVYLPELVDILVAVAEIDLGFLARSVLDAVREVARRHV